MFGFFQLKSMDGHNLIHMSISIAMVPKLSRSNFDLNFSLVVTRSPSEATQ